MSEINKALYHAINDLKYHCRSMEGCADCPLNIKFANGDVECIFMRIRPCNFEMKERFFIEEGEGEEGE